MRKIMNQIYVVGKYQYKRRALKLGTKERQIQVVVAGAASTSIQNSAS